MPFDESEHPREGGKFAYAGGRKKPQGAADEPEGSGADDKAAVAAELESRIATMTPEQAGKAKVLVVKLRAGGETAATDRSKFIGATVGKAEHVYADGIEHNVAKMVGGEKVGSAKESHGDPLDVHLPGHAIEVKSLLKGTKQAITVHDDALLRKVKYAAANPGETYHTVAVDHRDRFGGGEFAANHSGHEIYYKRGSGRYALSKMHKVASPEELRTLIHAKDADLPEAARGSLPKGKAVAKLKLDAAKAHVARLSKDRTRKARIKAARIATT